MRLREGFAAAAAKGSVVISGVERRGASSHAFGAAQDFVAISLGRGIFRERRLRRRVSLFLNFSPTLLISKAPSAEELE